MREIWTGDDMDERLVFVEERPMAGRVVPIEPSMTIGRDECDVIVPDPEVSRRHAIVFAAGPFAVIEDLDSTNGTVVNGRAIGAAVELHEGDAVQLGSTVWHVRAPGFTTLAAALTAEIVARRGSGSATL